MIGIEQHAEAFAADALDVADALDEAEVRGRRVLKNFDLGRRRSGRSLTGGYPIRSAIDCRYNRQFVIRILSFVATLR
jgi:hypothetical protein